MKYYKNSDKLDVDPKLKEYLSKFKTIEDFRVVEPEINEMLQGVGNLRRPKNFRRYRSVSESDGTNVSAKKRPNTTITNRSDYVGNQQKQQQQHQQHHQQHHHYQQYSSSSNRHRAGSFGSGRVRSGSVGNKPQIVGRQYHQYGSSVESNSSGGYFRRNYSNKTKQQQQQQQYHHQQQQQYQQKPKSKNNSNYNNNADSSTNQIKKNNPSTSSNATSATATTSKAVKNDENDKKTNEVSTNCNHSTNKTEIVKQGKS